MVRLRLQQDRIHIHGGLDAGRLGLRRLGPPDLSAVNGDARVQRHVLRLERRHTVAGAREQSTEGCREHALADARAGSLDHEARREPAHRDGVSATATVTLPLFTFSTTRRPPETWSAAGSATPWTPTYFMGASDAFGTSGTA